MDHATLTINWLTGCTQLNRLVSSRDFAQTRVGRRPNGGVHEADEAHNQSDDRLQREGGAVALNRDIECRNE